MTEEKFWSLIDSSREKFPQTMSASADFLTAVLSEGTVQDCIDYHNRLWDLIAESYRWDLWGAAYIINGGCSDDSFLYFRAWLVGNGQLRFRAALADPEAVGDWVNDGDRIFCEAMLGPGQRAYESITGTSMPHTLQTTKYPQEPIGEPWDEPDLARTFPRLTAKFE